MWFIRLWKHKIKKIIESKKSSFIYTFLFNVYIFYPNETFYYPWLCKDISTNQKSKQANYPMYTRQINIFILISHLQCFIVVIPLTKSHNVHTQVQSLVLLSFLGSNQSL